MGSEKLWLEFTKTLFVHHCLFPYLHHRLPLPLFAEPRFSFGMFLSEIGGAYVFQIVDVLTKSVEHIYIVTP